ncbi:hypothetical protein EJB05_05834, partial [Eragrostis curvula]
MPPIAVYRAYRLEVATGSEQSRTNSISWTPYAQLIHVYKVQTEIDLFYCVLLNAAASSRSTYQNEAP